MNTTAQKMGRCALVLVLAAVLLAGGRAFFQEEHRDSIDAASPSLDLTAPELDFSAYTGTVYAWGQGGVSHASDTSFLNLDPCGPSGEDKDHTRYNIPLAKELTIPDELKLFLSGLSSVRGPDLYEIDLKNGAVVAIRGDISNEGTGLDLSGFDLDFTGYTGRVYAKRAYRAEVASLDTLDYAEDGIEILYFDPCQSSGWDRDDASYAVPLAEKADIPEPLFPYLSGLSSARYPDLYILELIDGEVTTVRGTWLERDPYMDIGMAAMDLSDYTGKLYAQGSKEIAYFLDDPFLTLRGCQLPLAEDVEISDETMRYLTHLSGSANYPDYYAVSLAHGQVVQVQGLWLTED